MAAIFHKKLFTKTLPFLQREVHHNASNLLKIRQFSTSREEFGIISSAISILTRYVNATKGLLEEHKWSLVLKRKMELNGGIEALSWREMCSIFKIKNDLLQVYLFISMNYLSLQRSRKIQLVIPVKENK